MLTRFSWRLKQRIQSLATLSGNEIRDFASVLKDVLVRFDNLWQMPFPYVMPLHQAPTDGGDYSGFHFHIEFHPPLRKPNLLKFLAGPEIGGGNFLSDTSPDESRGAARAIQRPLQTNMSDIRKLLGPVRKLHERFVPQWLRHVNARRWARWQRL